MAVYTYMSSKRFGDPGSALIVNDSAGVARLVKIGYAIDITPATLAELQLNYVFQAGGSQMAPVYTVISTGIANQFRPIMYDPTTMEMVPSAAALSISGGASSLIPSSGQKDALQGSFGTPNISNRYLTETDPSTLRTSEWRTLEERQGIIASQGATTHVLGFGGSSAAAATGASMPATWAFYFDPADLTLTGQTLGMRLRFYLYTGAAAPGVNLTASIYSITSFAIAAASGTITTNAVQVTSNATITSATASAANTTYLQTSGAITVPAAGWYYIGISPGASAATNYMCRVALQYRNVDT